MSAGDGSRRLGRIDGAVMQSPVADTDEAVNGPAAVQRFLAQFPEENRAEALHLALRALRARMEPDRVLACELAWEVHTRGYWSHVHGDDGRPYETEEAYFRDVLGLASWRTAYKRLAIGRMLMRFEERERAMLRITIAEVGVAKSAVVVPAIERLGQWRAWLKLARELSAAVLQAQVSAALQAVPRGREPSPPGEHFRRVVLSAMPDIEAMEVVERFFELGARIAGTGHPIAIFLAGCRECLAEWEVQFARERVANIGDTWLGRLEQGSDSVAARSQTNDETDLPTWRVCPRGQNGHGS
jgi:hypothetical protein